MKIENYAIQQFLAKKEGGANYVYEKTYRLVYSLCFDVLRHNQDAEDAAMEAYEAILNCNKRFPNGKAFLSYLCVSARNIAIDMAKKRGRIEEMEDEGSVEQEIVPMGDDALFQAIRKELSKQDYDLVIWHDCLDLPFPVIASMQGGTASSCRGRYFRAMKKLRLALKEEDFR